MTRRGFIWLTIIIPALTLFWSSVAAAFGIAVDAACVLIALAITVLVFSVAVAPWRRG